MEEQLISFETAKLAKDKEWKYPTLNFYFEDGESKENVLEQITGMDYGSQFSIEFSELIENWNNKWLTKKDGSRCFGCSKTKGYLETFSAPTQSLLQKWLREIYMIRIFPHQGAAGNFKFDIFTYPVPNSIGKWERSNNIQSYNTYEEALEAGLQEALKLIK